MDSIAMDKSVARTCPNCGTRFSGRALAGLCPACVARRTLAPEPDRLAPRLASGAPAAPTGLRFFGDYELLEEIARGGMGVVYKARQLGLNRIVAVKMVLAGQLASASDVLRFRTEPEAAANLQHPNIVAIHEVGDHEGRHFFSMDYVAGASLAEAGGELSAKGDFPRAARWLKTIAEAIHYAHQRGILHRDLKPSNILIDGADQPRITDFGLAKQVKSDSDITVSGQVLGTPNFMPPEQAAGKRGAVGPQSDVYSLGAILYFLLTGKAPFAAEAMHETLLQVINVEPVSPRSLNPAVPRDLETIALKCLEKAPAGRYQSAQELAEDLNRFLRAEPILARPSSLAGKFLRICLKHRLVTSLVLALLILPVVVGLIVRRFGDGTPQAGQRAGEQKPIAPMPNRSGNGVAAVIDGKIYVTSALIGEGPVRKLLHVYDPKLNSWKQLTDSAVPHPNAAAGVIDGKLFVAGGIGGENSGITLEVYDPRSGAWTTKAPMPTPRGACAGAVINERLYVVGGNYETNFLPTMESYDPLTDKWTREPSMPTARASCGAVAINGELYVVGGTINQSGQHAAMVERWKPGERWRSGDPMPAPVATAFVAAMNGLVCVAGGKGPTGEIADLQVLLPHLTSTTGLWDVMKPMPEARYHGSGAVVFGGELYVFGGWRSKFGGGGGLPHTDVFVYNPARNSWR